MKKPSFSLVEILVCISIVLMLVGISVPRFFDLDKALLMQELDTLLVTFSYIQQRAIASNSQEAITFNLGDNNYYYVNKNGQKVCHALANSARFGFLKMVKGPPSTPINLITKPITFEHSHHKEPRAIFYPDGKITPGSIYLIDKKEKYMVALTSAISQVSYVRKYTYSNNKWICI